ncbi:uncharacterized protein MONOS_16035 [Monocercomonoides exilis]|uniref:uncharacterized protein n=1 Tax=Monocercomonoides exilis TaxID=2049356 RepID=UPI003559DD4C|nr:hypothetical protein MONOS_16035 [Monocercomonoides exilis]|eukprot:MONOS_16035.1-p1 / transcript=MONOS_16035.1 / gene=MONOS_16035 / organism=Monocercomonoides_exilis_PA203 / gene_product=unspecified product / transcript_product=unspecified product / location=Mono_scaffold01468:4202-6093(-) / protein_length=469 / sequence_SO=supercontig / SO=protein_coding / is_pseudo=false
MPKKQTRQQKEKNTYTHSLPCASLPSSERRFHRYPKRAIRRSSVLFSHPPQPSPVESLVRPLCRFLFLQPSPRRKMERKKKTRTQLDQMEAEKRRRARAEDTAITVWRLFLCHEDILSCLPLEQHSAENCRHISEQLRKTGLRRLLHERLLKPTTIPSSHAGATGGILANDANLFLNLLCGTRLFSLGGEDAVRDAQLVENMRKEMNVWRGEGRAAVEGGDEARGTAELFCEERGIYSTVPDVQNKINRKNDENNFSLFAMERESYIINANILLDLLLFASSVFFEDQQLLLSATENEFFVSPPRIACAPFIGETQFELTDSTHTSTTPTIISFSTQSLIPSAASSNRLLLRLLATRAALTAVVTTAYRLMVKDVLFHEISTIFETHHEQKSSSPSMFISASLIQLLKVVGAALSQQSTPSALSSAVQQTSDSQSTSLASNITTDALDLSGSLNAAADGANATSVGMR